MAKKLEGVDRGKQQSDASGQAGRVMRAGFRAGSDHGPVTKRAKAARGGETKPKAVNSYPKQFQSASQQIDAALMRRRKS